MSLLIIKNTPAEREMYEYDNTSSKMIPSLIAYLYLHNFYGKIQQN